MHYVAFLFFPCLGMLRGVETVFIFPKIYALIPVVLSRYYQTKLKNVSLKYGAALP